MIGRYQPRRVNKIKNFCHKAARRNSDSITFIRNFLNAPDYWRIIHVTMFKGGLSLGIYRTARHKFLISHFNCVRTWSFYIFDICMTFLRLFRGIVYRRPWIGIAHVEWRKRLSRVSRSPSNVISTFPIAVAYFRICFQFPFGKSHIKTADRHVNSVRLFRADSTPL